MVHQGELHQHTRAHSHTDGHRSDACEWQQSLAIFLSLSFLPDALCEPEIITDSADLTLSTSAPDAHVDAAARAPTLPCIVLSVPHERRRRKRTTTTTTTTTTRVQSDRHSHAALCHAVSTRAETAAAVWSRCTLATETATPMVVAAAARAVGARTAAADGGRGNEEPIPR
jgi:hypothetical protein